MKDFFSGQVKYTFIGQNLIEFKIIEEIDELRVRGGDKDCTYVVYKKDCYESEVSAIEGMYYYLVWLDTTRGKCNYLEVMREAQERN